MLPRRRPDKKASMYRSVRCPIVMEPEEIQGAALILRG